MRECYNCSEMVPADINTIVADIEETKKIFFSILDMLNSMGKMPSWFPEMYAIADAVFHSPPQNK